MKNRSDRDDYELPEEYDFSGKAAIRGRFYSPKKKSVTIRLDDDYASAKRMRSRVSLSSRIVPGVPS